MHIKYIICKACKTIYLTNHCFLKCLLNVLQEDYLFAVKKSIVDFVLKEPEIDEVGNSPNSSFVFFKCRDVSCLRKISNIFKKGLVLNVKLFLIVGREVLRHGRRDAADAGVGERVERVEEVVQIVQKISQSQSTSRWVNDSIWQSWIKGLVGVKQWKIFKGLYPSFR
jgi:hypothetical protein